MLHLRTLARQLFVDKRAAVPVARGWPARGTALRKRLEHLSRLCPEQVRAEEVVP
jgi:hypothetical protein